MKDERDVLARQFADAVLGKVVVEIRMSDPRIGFELVFHDGSEVEVCSLDDEMAFVYLTAQEAEEARRDNQG